MCIFHGFNLTGDRIIKSTLTSRRNMITGQAPSEAFFKLTDSIQSAMQHFSIPGVSVGVLFKDQEFTAALGVTSIENPLGVTPETLFQIGSITKTFTGTAAMRLVEMEKLHLDKPVRYYIPELKLSDESVAQRVTLLHLLTHTAGWEGDYFNDFGLGDDALAKMVANLVNLQQLTPLGEVWSYNNAGFYLAGRLIEVVSGMPYEAALKALILSPLGMEQTFFFAHDVISYRFAVGRAIHPIGGLVTNIPDLFRYARFHMGDGTAQDGTRLLKAETLAKMHTPYIPATGIRSFGLSWGVVDIDGHRLISHGGGTKGQVTFLGIAPAQRFALVILTNGEDGDSVTSSAWKEALKFFLDLEMPEAQPIQAPLEKMMEYTGRYDTLGETLELKLNKDRFLLQIYSQGGFPTPDVPAMPDPPPVSAALCGEDCLVVLDEPMKGNRGEFLRDKAGKIEWLRLSGRVHRRIY
jgi:CubicO group peptidase (beta-lactamase class C family)